jgi:glycerol kinase
MRELCSHWKEDRRWEPRWSAEERETGYASWQRAVQRTLL